MRTTLRISLLLAGALALAACGSGPTITSFAAGQNTVGYGGPVTLTWTVQDAQSLSLEGPGDGAGAVSGTSAVVYPTATGQWVLSATNGHGTTKSQPVAITVTANLEVAAGTVNSGSVGTTVLFRARDAQGNAPATDWTVHVVPDAAAGAPLDVVCTGGSDTCVAELDAIKPTGTGWSADMTLGGQNVSITFDPTSDILSKPSISASYNSGNDSIDATWDPIAGAVLYVAQAFDLDSGQPISDALTTSIASASLPLTSALNGTGNYGVQVIAAAVDPNQQIAGPLPEPNMSLAVGYLNNVPGSRWAVYGPSDYNGSGQLVVNLPNLGAGEQLAIIPINIGGLDNITATISVSGTNPLALKAPTVANYLWQIRQQPDRSTVDLRALARTGEARVRTRERERLSKFLAAHPNFRLPVRKTAKVSPLLSAAVAPAPNNTSFCVSQGVGADALTVRKTATLQYESAHAIFYADDDDLAQYTSFDWHDGAGTGLADLWDDTIYPKDTQTFGSESDIDGNGKLVVFFSHELGAPSSNGIVLGYYGATDVVGALDSTPDCSGGGSNASDMFYMNAPANIENAGYSLAQITDEIYPDTLGHEFQHLINFWQHTSANGGNVTLEDPWINEGLSVTAEDIIGFGWNNAGGRADGSRYFAYYSNDGYTRYFDASLTQWEGDPIGNYQGSHSFFRYFTDRFGTSILGQLDQTAQTGLPNLENVLGETFEQAYAEWTIALMFSNEIFSPDPSRFDFTGVNWTPLYSALSSPTNCPYPGHDGHVGYLPLDTSANATLRTDGWNAFVTGTGNNAPVTITVTPGASAPYLAVVRFSGVLPNGDLTTCP